MKTLINKLNYITDIFWQINTKDDLKNFLQDLFTPGEIEMLYERLQIIKLLKKWLSQREIAEKLNTSTATVNRWARVLKYGTWVLNKLKL
jgi:TrpR family trp operon transcriptional repressor